MKTASTSRLVSFNLRLLVGFALCVAGLILAFGAMSSAAAEDNDATDLTRSVPTQLPGKWRVTRSMITARADHTATLLPNGQVLAAGGYGNTGYLASAELYDRATEMWRPTGSMGIARYFHTATLLRNGQVLVAAGYSDFGYRTVRNYTIRRPVCGRRPVSWPRAFHPSFIRRHCYGMGRCSLPAASILSSKP